MKRFNIGSAIFAMIMGGCILLSGCTTNYATRQDVSQMATVTREDMRTLQKDIDMVAEQVQNLAHHLEAQQQRLQELEKYLGKVDDKISAKSEEVYSRIARQMADMEKRQNKQALQLRKAINAKINEINRVLATLSGPGPAAAGGTETGFYHTVAENESLWSISRKYADYRVSVDDIKKANGISAENDTIKPGQKLFIPARRR